MTFPAGLLVSTLVSAQQTDTTGIYSDRQDSLDAVIYVSRYSDGTLARGKDLRTELISSSGLQKMACCNLAESFENSASVTVGYSDATTGARQIRLLGLSGIYTQMLDENRPAMRGLSAPFGLSYVPGPWLESIQIAKGSPSVINGAESMTGQINMEHRKPTDQRLLFVTGNMMHDTKGDINIFSAFNATPDLYGSVFAHVSGNFVTQDMNDDGFVDDPKQLQFNVASRWLYYRPDLQIRWGIRAIHDHRRGGMEDYGRDSYSLAADSPWGSDITNRSLSAYLKIGKPLREDGSSSVAVVADWNLQAMDAYFGATSYTATQNSVFVNLLYRNQINDSHDFTVGLSGVYDWYNEDINRVVAAMSLEETPNTQLGSGGPFAEYTCHYGEMFSSIVGVRMDWYKDEGFRFVPRVTLKFQPWDCLIIRANGGRGLRFSTPLVDNIGVFSTGKSFIGDYGSHILEDSWTFGGNATVYIPMGYDPEATYLSFDWFSTRFTQQLIVDYEHTENAIVFYALDGERSFTDNYQLDFNIEPFNRFTVTVTGRYTNAKVTLEDKGLVERPMMSKFKGVLNLQYKTNMEKWQFDFTFSVNGSARVYDFMQGLSDMDGNVMYENGRTPVYPMLYAQITRRFKNFEIYLGGENLTGFMQDSPIISCDDPSSASFDASAIWGPLMGARLNAGFRWTIWHRNKS